MLAWLAPIGGGKRCCGHFLGGRLGRLFLSRLLARGSLRERRSRWGLVEEVVEPDKLMERAFVQARVLGAETCHRLSAA